MMTTKTKTPMTNHVPFVSADEIDSVKRDHERRVADQTTAAELVHRYNVLAHRANAEFGCAFKPVKVFHDKPTALTRIAHVESAIARGDPARGQGLTNLTPADAAAVGEIDKQTDEDRSGAIQRQQTPGRARLLADPRAEQARQQTLADQEGALNVVKKTRKRTIKEQTNGGEPHEHKWAAQHKIIARLLSRRSGCTRQEVLDATGWETVSVAMQAKMIGVPLRKERTEDGDLRYFAD